MKLSVDREEKKGPFGGTYYESKIKITLTEEEEKVGQKIRLMSKVLFRLDPNKSAQYQDNQVIFAVKGREDSSTLTVRDLVRGVTAKCHGESDISSLAFAENQIREKCKQIKAAIENYNSAKDAINKGKYEEEI